MCDSIKGEIEKLEILFSKFNEKLFDAELIKPIITIQKDDCSSYGWFTTGKVWEETGATEESDEKKHHEINICAEHLTRELEEVAGVLLHEMVHLYNNQKGIQDYSRSGTYHNKKFATACETHGLTCEKTDKYGWAITELNSEMKKYVSELEIEDFSIARKSPKKIKGTSKASSRSIKHECYVCGNIARTTKSMELICGACGVRMFAYD